MADATTLIHDIFVPGVPILEKILRPMAIYFFLIVSIRLAGKRTLASLNAFDLVVILSISNTVQNAIIGEDTSVLGGIIGASTLLITNFLVVRFFFRHQRLDRLIEGRATTLIKHGKIIKRNLDRELITEPELTVAAHKQGFHHLDEVDSAEIEPGGAVVFFAKTPTPAQERDQELHRKLDELAARVAQLLETRKPT
jgi:uncharacterized membrane protein YcaP (DUF421 family)